MGKTNKFELPEITPEFIKEMKKLSFKGCKYNKKEKSFIYHKDKYTSFSEGIYYLYFRSRNIKREETSKYIKNELNKKFNIKISVKNTSRRGINVTLDFSNTTIAEYEKFKNTYKNVNVEWGFESLELRCFNSKIYAYMCNVSASVCRYNINIIEPINYEVRKTSSLANTVFQPL